MRSPAMAKLMLCGVNEKSIVAKTILAMVACMCPTGGSTSEFGTSTVLFLAAKCSGMLCTALLIFDGIYGWTRTHMDRSARQPTQCLHNPIAFADHILLFLFYDRSIPHNQWSPQPKATSALPDVSSPRSIGLPTLVSERHTSVFVSSS